MILGARLTERSSDLHNFNSGIYDEFISFTVGDIKVQSRPIKPVIDPMITLKNQVKKIIGDRLRGYF